MSKLDTSKEIIAYLKFWLGVLVVSDISLVGWLLSSSSTSSNLKLYGAILAIVIITVSAFIVHKKIEKLIFQLTEL